MAQKKNDDGVTLIGPQGDQVTVKSPAGINNYVFGHGYKPKQGTVDEAIQAVAPPESEASPTAEPMKPKG